MSTAGNSFAATARMLETRAAGEGIRPHSSEQLESIA
jgi:hypothetical protein